MVRALVTGSAGCLGSNLVAALNERGVEVVGLRWKNEPITNLDGLKVKLVEGDILDLKSLRLAMQGVDWVFHVAAIADDWNFSTEEVYRTNVEGTRNVFQAAEEAGVKRFVLTSSAAALGVPQSDATLLDENCRFNIAPHIWAYGYSKHLAEQVMAEFVERGMHAVSVLPTAIIGKGDTKFIVGQLITRALSGEIFPFPEGGSNFIDVRDVALAQIAAAEYGHPGARYLLGGHNMPHTEYVKIIGKVLGVGVKCIHVPRWVLPPLSESVAFLRKLGMKFPVEEARVLLSGKFMYYDSSKAKRELGLRVRPFAESVDDTFQWYRAHGLLKSQNKSMPAFT